MPRNPFFVGVGFIPDSAVEPMASTSEGRTWSSEDTQPCSFKVVSHFRTLLL
jgi:hypothetical protein